MGMVTEFKKFALKGNMLDMAVGIMIGSAFSTVIKSLVDNILMPPIGYLTNQIDVSSLVVNLKVPGSEPVEIRYGLFLNSLISLIIVAMVLFLVIKAVNKAREQFDPEEPTEPKMKLCQECKMQIPVEATRCGHCTTKIAA